VGSNPAGKRWLYPPNQSLLEGVPARASPVARRPKCSLLHNIRTSVRCTSPGKGVDRYCLSMIARIWRGAVRREDAAAYTNYIAGTGMAEYRSTPGNQGAWMLRRDDGDRSEIITFSLWDSRDSIRAFAGEDIEQAVFYPDDDRFLIERDATVRHYEVVA
jgi:heme-degrading monooxygenase HmoA